VADDRRQRVNGQPETYAEFWHRYLRAHASRRTRIAHYLGTSFAIGAAVLFLITAQSAWLIAIPLAYAVAWISHGVSEQNRPLTFTRPMWSLVSDFRMFFLAVAGRLGEHLRAAMGGQR
jgi:hypothetical protein